MIIRPRYNIIKPPGGLVVNAGHRLADDLLSAYILNEGGGRRVNDIAGIDHLSNWGATGSGDPTWDNGRRVLDQTTGVYAVASPRLKIDPPVSIAWRGYITGNSSANISVFGVGENGTNASPYVSYLLVFDGSGNAAVYFNRSGTFTGILSSLSGSSFGAGTPTLLVFTAADGVQKLYANDANEISNGTYSWTTTQYQSTARISFSANNNAESGNAVLRGDFGMVWNRVLSRDEVSELYREPYVWLRPQGSSIRRFEFGFTTSIADQTITGGSTIASGEAFGAGSVNGPITGDTTIASGESFFSGGTVSADLDITGVTTIASGESFSSAGFVTLPSPQTITGVSAIAGGESFASPGSVDYVLTGYATIASGETFLAGGAVIGNRTFTLHVGGRDRTNWLKVDSLNVSEELRGRASASFELNDVGRFTYRPNPDDEVVFFYQGARIFGGLVQECTEQAYDSRSDVRINVSCTDYRDLAERRVFGKIFTGPTFDLRTILQEIYTATLEAEGINWDYDAAETATVEGKRLVFNDDTVAACLDRLCAVFGFNWRIDRYRTLRVERRQIEMAPQVIRDNGVWRSMKVKRSNKNTRTVQGVRTSAPVAGQRTTTLAGNGTHQYLLGYSFTYAPKVVVDTVEKTVIAWEDRGTAPWDFAWESGSNLLRHNPTQTAYTSSNSIVVTHASSTLDVLWIEDTEAIARLAARTGGSGIIEAVTTAKDIRDKGIAEAFGGTMLQTFGADITSIEFETDTPGWAIGQWLSVYVAAPRCAGNYIVQQVSMREVGATYLTYTVTAQARELPLIAGIEIDAEAGMIDITVDRPVIDPGSEINLWGAGGLEPIWGTQPVDSFGGTNIRIPIPAGVDPGDLEYHGGIGGTEYRPNVPIEEPIGGNIWSGTGPEPGTGGGGEGIGNGEDVLVITNVNTTTNEVTTNRAHGFTDSYPTGDFRVAIWGVTGATGPTVGGGGISINTASTRIDVTSTTTFIARDVGILYGTGAEPFQDDRKGRCASTDVIMRTTLGGGTGNTGLLPSFAGGSPPLNVTQEVGTFFFIGAPVSVGPSAASPWYAQQDIAVLESASVQFDTPPSGSNVILDIKQNGVSIFAAGQYLEYPADGAGTVRATAFRESPLVVNRDDKFDVDVVGVGSDFAGCNGKVHVVTKA